MSCRLLALLAIGVPLWGDSALTGKVQDLQGSSVVGATVGLYRGSASVVSVTTDKNGAFLIERLPGGQYTVKAAAAGFQPITRDVDLADGTARTILLEFSSLESKHDSVAVTSSALQPGVDLRNEEVFKRTLFSRDDQVLQRLNAGISAGQHEGGGKSLEIRRFGFNLDHGGANGGLKVLLDGVQQNQGTQGHGQGYLGSLKSLSPELIQDVTIVSGPFLAEYGDFSGLGVVHIKQREELPQRYAIRLQGGNFNSRRAFLAFSPDVQRQDAYAAYDGALTGGPFLNPSRYRRDNGNANYTKTLREGEKLGVRLLFGRNNFFSSGQLPLDLVDSGALDRFSYLDPTQGGRVKLGTLSAHYDKAKANGGTLRLDGFVARSLFDLYSNFTYFLNDPVNGDAIQQHDSRLQEGFNSQWMHSHRIAGSVANFVAGSNYHDNQINVGLYPRQGRIPTGVTAFSHAHVTNVAGYLQESVSLLHSSLLITGGLRYDTFRYGLADRLDPSQDGSLWSGRWQGKASAAYTPSRNIPFTLHANYGRGITSLDARAVVYRPDRPRLATTDFYQAGVSSSLGRFALAVDSFLIDRSHEQVYIPDDGTIDLNGPSRAYGYEAKASAQLTRHVFLNAGLTKVGNAFYRGLASRVPVTNAPHFTGNAGINVADWHGWSGSLHMRAINHYALDGDYPGVLASGHTVFDFALSRRVRRNMDFNLALDNLTNRSYFETQNYFESRPYRDVPGMARIHGTPGFPLTVVVGVTLRLGEK